MSAAHCLNCNTALHGAYCHACGQKASTHRLSMKHFIAHDLVHGLFHLDGSFPRTLKAAIVRPGKAALQYIAGHRAGTFNLVTLLVILAGLNAFATSKLDSAGNQSSVLQISLDSTKQEPSPLPKAALDTARTARKQPAPVPMVHTASTQESRSARAAVRSRDWVKQNRKWILLSFIPLISLANWIVFRRTRYNYAENIVVAAFLLSGMLALGIAATVLTWLVDKLIPGRINFQSIVSLGYLAFAYWQTFRRHYSVGGWLWRSLATYALFATAFISVAFIVFVIGALITEGTSVFFE